MEQMYKLEDVIKEEQKGFRSSKLKNVTLDEILNSVKDILGSFPEYKKRNIVKYQIYCYLANQYTYKSKVQISKKGGYKGVDFVASVVVAIDKYDKNYKKDEVFRTIVNACRSRIEDINSSIENQRETILKSLDFKLEKLTVDQLKITYNYINKF
tara:strand:- start:2518 stop:2982 length:465 start_codon:yes stop_codon:yes gene_type:complete